MWAEWVECIIYVYKTIRRINLKVGSRKGNIWIGRKKKESMTRIWACFRILLKLKSKLRPLFPHL